MCLLRIHLPNYVSKYDSCWCFGFQWVQWLSEGLWRSFFWRSLAQCTCTCMYATESCTSIQGCSGASMHGCVRSQNKQLSILWILRRHVVTPLHAPHKLPPHACTALQSCRSARVRAETEAELARKPFTICESTGIDVESKWQQGFISTQKQAEDYTSWVSTGSDVTYSTNRSRSSSIGLNCFSAPEILKIDSTSPRQLNEKFIGKPKETEPGASAEVR